jgi:hypothetical protein
LKARKDGGRWVVPREELPLSDAAVARGLADQARLKGVLETALGTPAGPAGAKRRYSVNDLKVFGIGRTLLASLREALGEQAKATGHIASSLALITCGCHTFQKRDKVVYLQRAREQVCYGLAALLLAEQEQVRSLAEPIESEMLPALGGVIRSAERRR